MDILAKIPSIIQATDELLEERTFRILGPVQHRPEFEIMETPSTVADLQQRLECISVELALWKNEWQFANAPQASDILDWALFRTGDNFYRPGIYGAQGPDVYGLNMSNPADLDIPFPLKSAARNAEEQLQLDNNKMFTLLQDTSLYITVLIWTERLRKNLTGAARSSDAIDFYNAPFHTECHCYYDQPGPSRRCQIFPRDPAEAHEARMAWNIQAPKISEAPVRVASSKSTELTAKGRLLLPGDGRFAAQLRILNFLAKYLSAGSRSHVLSTLAAMGISHCVHDVRPSEGNEAIAETIRGTMAKSGFEEVADALLRNYG